MMLVNLSQILINGRGYVTVVNLSVLKPCMYNVKDAKIGFTTRSNALVWNQKMSIRPKITFAEHVEREIPQSERRNDI